jgi:hypothetical protein
VPRVLHLIKDPANQTPFTVLAEQARDPANTLTVVLLQQAAALREALPGQVFRLAEQDNGSHSPYPPIDHSRLLDLIFEADTVVTW